MINIKNLISIAIEASIDAGKEILKVYESDDFQISSKEDKSPLTLADQNAHNKIVGFLEKTEIPVPELVAGEVLVIHLTELKNLLKEMVNLQLILH